MIFRENRLLADDFHEISYLIFVCRKLGKILLNVLSAAVVIGTLRVKLKVLLKNSALNIQRWYYFRNTNPV